MTSPKFQRLYVVELTYENKLTNVMYVWATSQSQAESHGKVRWETESDKGYNVSASGPFDIETAGATPPTGIW